MKTDLNPPEYMQNIPSFWTGFFTTFNVFGLFEYHYPYKNDTEAIEKDWRIIGQDMFATMDKFKANHIDEQKEA